MILPGGCARGDAHPEVIASRRRDIHLIGEIFARIQPADVETAASIGRDFSVHSFGGSIRPAVVGGVYVMVGNPLAPVVLVLSLDDAGYRDGRSRECLLEYAHL